MKTAIITLAIGIERYFYLTLPLIANYSKYINSEFICINKPLYSKFPNMKPQYEKLQIKNYLKKFDRILFIDADIIINTKDNFFDLNYSQENKDHIWMFPDPLKITDQSVLNSFLKLEMICGPTKIKQENIIHFNSGVFSITQNHLSLFNEKIFLNFLRVKDPSDFLHDQNVFNYIINKERLNVFALNPIWNYLIITENAKKKTIEEIKRDNPNFIHFAGIKNDNGYNRFDVIQKYLLEII